MLKSSARFYQTAILSLLVIVGFSAIEIGAQSPDEETSALDDSLCELSIEGEGILTLGIVQKETGLIRRISHPSESLQLPAGEYVLREVVMENGYEFVPGGFVVTHFELTPDETCVLQVGGPLHPSAEVKRSGAYYSLDYIVVDAAGRRYEDMSYDNIDYSSPPQFVVYDSDGKEVGSGAFNYG